ncbi:MAG TPA: hypothetical protein VK966_03745, partial [Longimicrobiales bacterium]|nr:hypothetical protein [Longimicrobiales bacterium]
TEVLPNGATLVHHVPAEDVPVTWRLEEELRIGALDGDGADQFGRVGGLAVGGDGEIVVLDAQAQELRVFSPDGEHLRTLGGKGGGPGEMEGANGVVMGPDGLARVPDGRNNRISFFDLEDGFVRSHPYQPMFMTWVWDGVVDAEGTAWSVHWIPSDEPGERGRTAYVGYDPSGTAVDTLPHPADEQDTRQEQPGLWQVERDGVPMASLGVPFYPRQQHVLTPGLQVWSTYEGDPSYRLKRWAPAGDTTLVLQLDRPLQPADRALADSIASEWEKEFDTSLDRSKIPDVAPATSGHFLDDDGRLWVHANTADSDSVRTMDAFDADNGDWLGTVATDLTVLAAPSPVIRGDKVWAVVTDELDVQYIVRGVLRGAW